MDSRTPIAPFQRLKKMYSSTFQLDSKEASPPPTKTPFPRLDHKYQTTSHKFVKDPEIQETPSPQITDASSSNLRMVPAEMYQTEGRSPQLPRTSRPIKYVDLSLSREISYSTAIIELLDAIAKKAKDVQDLTSEVTTPNALWKRIKIQINIKQQRVLSHALENLGSMFRRLQVMLEGQELPPPKQGTEQLDKLWVKIIEPITIFTQAISDVMFRKHPKLEIYKIDGLDLARALHFVSVELSRVLPRLGHSMEPSLRKWTDRTLVHMDHTAESYRVFTINSCLSLDGTDDGASQPNSEVQPTRAEPSNPVEPTGRELLRLKSVSSLKAELITPGDDVPMGRNHNADQRPRSADQRFVSRSYEAAPNSDKDDGLISFWDML